MDGTGARRLQVARALVALAALTFAALVVATPAQAEDPTTTPPVQWIVRADLVQNGAVTATPLPQTPTGVRVVFNNPSDVPVVIAQVTLRGFTGLSGGVQCPSGIRLPAGSGDVVVECTPMTPGMVTGDSGPASVWVNWIDDSGQSPAGDVTATGTITRAAPPPPDPTTTPPVQWISGVSLVQDGQPTSLLRPSTATGVRSSESSDST